jgi:UDP-GlcNAc:undecaprenyl-phosphate GlcNAc-1-phosphate transferase
VIALAAIAALVASYAVIWAALRSPLARRLSAAPRDDRWHERETPVVGGLGLIAGLTTGVLVAVGLDVVEPTSELWGVLGGCTLLFLAGFVDDLWALPAWAKLAAQFGAAAIALAGGLTVEIVASDWIAVPLAVAWLVGMTNAFNLLDNMDGLAATLAAIASGYFALAVTVEPNDTVLVLALSLAFACVGFLRFNLRVRGSAAAFMGDSGSQLLGFAVACFGLLTSYKVAGSTAALLLLPVLILAVPILDTTLVTIVRLLEGRPIHQGGRDHASHRLVYHGLSEKRSVVLLALVSAALGGTSLAYTVLDRRLITIFGVLVTFALLVQFASFLSDVDRERRPAGSSFLALHRRRFAEVVVDFALISAAFLAAYLLRVEGEGTVTQRYIFTSTLPILLAARYLAFIPFGLYRGVWRYAGARDAAAVVAAVVVSEFVAFGVLAAIRDLGDFPKSVFVIDALICTVLVGAARFWERGAARGLSSFRPARRKTVIVGAGRGGRSLLRELRETPGEQVVGFVDDDPVLRRRRLQGVPVLGGTFELERVLERARPDVVLVTIPDAPHERLNAIVAACAAAEVPCRFVRREVDLDPRVVLGSTAE